MLPADLNLLRPPVCLEQTGTALLARQGEYQDDTSSMQDSRLARRAAAPAGRAPGMARVNPDGMLAQCFGSKPPFGGFCVYSTLSDEDLLFDTGLPGANRNGAAGSQSEYQDDTSKTPGAFLNVFACEDGPKGERQGWCE